MPDRPLSATALEHRLDEFLDPVLSIRRTTGALARDIATVTRPQQTLIMHWIGMIAKTNPEVAYQFAQQAPTACGLMDAGDIEAWVIAAMDAYDKLGMYPAIAVCKDVQTFATQAQEKARGVDFDEVACVLALFLRGLSGRALNSRPRPSATPTPARCLCRRGSRASARASRTSAYTRLRSRISGRRRDSAPSARTSARRSRASTTRTGRGACSTRSRPCAWTRASRGNTQTWIAT